MKSRLHRTTQQMRATLDADARVSFTRAAGDMTNRVDFDRRLASWLDEDVAPHAPGELAIIDRQSQVQATIPDADGSAPSWQHLGV